jgi:hypothetical protein
MPLFSLTEEAATSILSVHRNPFDVLKTLSQTNKGESVALGTLVGQMYQNQGMAGFYRGVEGMS